MKIHNVTHNKGLGYNRYCGPAAISALTGRSAECAVRWILYARGYKPGERNAGVKGCSETEVLKALHYLGYTYQVDMDLLFERRTTLAQWLRKRSDRRSAYLVCVTGHWMIIQGNRGVHSHQPTICATSQLKCRRAIMRRAIRISPLDNDQAKKTRRERLDPLPKPNTHYQRTRDGRVLQVQICTV